MCSCVVTRDNPVLLWCWYVRSGLSVVGNRVYFNLGLFGGPLLCVVVLSHPVLLWCCHVRTGLSVVGNRVYCANLL